MSKEKVLTKKDLRKAAWRWLIGISTFNYETQLAPSTLFSVYPCLRKMYPDDEDLKKSCLNYMRYYNTMPWTAGRYRRYHWLGNDTYNFRIHCGKHGNGGKSTGNLPMGGIYLCVPGSPYSSV